MFAGLKNKEVKWVSTVKLKGKSIWEAEVNNNDNESHGWKELMRIRDKIKPYGNITDMLRCIRVKKSSEVLYMAQQWNLKWERERLISTTSD
ncbi:hypothetical protein Tco_1038806 [Tanacetum coccineum]